MADRNDRDQLNIEEIDDKADDHHSDYSLAPERITINPEDLSVKQIETLSRNKGLDEENLTIAKSTPKLIPNSRNKNRYIIHYRNLKFNLSFGMKLKGIHRVFSYLIKNLGLKNTLILAPFIEHVLL